MMMGDVLITILIIGVLIHLSIWVGNSIKKNF